MAPKQEKKGKGSKKAKGPAARQVTIHLSKRVHKITFKKKVPRAIREIKKFVQKAMRTSDVRIDTELNKFIWSKGIRNPPTRVRVHLERKRSEDEEKKGKLYTVVSWVDVDSFKGLQTTKESISEEAN